ncbi:excalibur calcium-binding domain-containing protein [Sphingobium sp. R-21]|uniref:excalibur calcium-binding domain-containing protein n=1 Tax=Sphingobium sp. R-21 TaxID=3404056 RepID=UPI003CF51D95
MLNRIEVSKMVRRLIASGVALVMAASFLVHGHPGGLNTEGCHNDRRTGSYHCHRHVPSQPPLQTLSGAGSGAFRNCAAARAAGAAPVRAGDPGYGRHLDRDGDGIGCE